MYSTHKGACAGLWLQAGRLHNHRPVSFVIPPFVPRRLLLLQLEGEATMKFVTSAYKKKLMEQQKWELQQQLEDEREQRNDVTKTGMSGYDTHIPIPILALPYLSLPVATRRASAHRHVYEQQFCSRELKRDPSYKGRRPH